SVFGVADPNGTEPDPDVRDMLKLTKTLVRRAAQRQIGDEARRIRVEQANGVGGRDDRGRSGARVLGQSDREYGCGGGDDHGSTGEHPGPAPSPATARSGRRARFAGPSVVAEPTARALGHEAMRYDARLPGPG